MPAAFLQSRRGVGLIELLTVVALLIVALALVVATARHVRASSANELTRKRIQALVDDATRLIVRGHLDPTLPIPADLDAAAAGLGQPDATPAGERAAALQRAEAALQNYAHTGADRLRELLDAERVAAAAESPTLADAARNPAAALVAGTALAGVAELRDAWGRPIALMPRQLPALGIAPDDGPFFVSAGPDGAFLTLADNLYSYDLPALLPRPGRSSPRAGHPATGDAPGRRRPARRRWTARMMDPDAAPDRPRVAAPPLDSWPFSRVDVTCPRRPPTSAAARRAQPAASRRSN